MTTPDPFAQPTFMAAPADVADWRLVLLYDAARSTGLLACLPDTVANAAARAGLDPHAARVVLDALASVGIVSSAEDGTIAPSTNAPDDATASQLRQHASAIRRWSRSLEPRLRAEPVADNAPFQLKAWLESMAVNAARQADTVADTAFALIDSDPAAIRALDLGGGHGRYAAALAARGAKVIMQDRPDVIAVVREAGWLRDTGVELIAGDFFDGLPEGPFDVVLAVGVMHTMAPDRAAALLTAVGERLRPGGVLIIRTMLRNESAASSLFAVQMLVAGMGGDAHRLEDYRHWLREAGMSEPQVSGIAQGSLITATRL